MGTPSLTLNDVIPPPWPPLLLPHDQYSRVANETLWCDRQYSRSCPSFLFLKIWSVSACMWFLYQFPIQGPNTDNFLCSLSRKMTSFHPKLINFWLSQLEVVFCSTFWRLQPGWAHLPPIWPKTDSVAGRQPPEGVHFLWIWRIDIAPSIPSQWLHFKIAKGWSSLFQVNGSDSDSRRQNPAQRIISDPFHNFAWKRDWKTILCNLCNIQSLTTSSWWVVDLVEGY